MSEGPLQITKTIQDARSCIAQFRQSGETIAVVPTMGYLHAGHMALLARAQASADRVVATIFVNPTQFDAGTDLDNYPRDEARDLVMLQDAKVDMVFMPSANEVYPDGDETVVEVTKLSNKLHGALRPGHFRGVSTVVTRLFNIIQPDYACFGEKDYQQLQVIRRMVRDLAIPVSILPVATVRDEDGLALSSRNARLSLEDRAAAIVLPRALDNMERIAHKPGTTVKEIYTIIADTIRSEPLASLQGLDIVRAESMEDLQDPLCGKIAIMLSVAFGDVLLLDQREITVAASSRSSGKSD